MQAKKREGRRLTPLQLIKIVREHKKTYFLFFSFIMVFIRFNDRKVRMSLAGDLRLHLVGEVI